MKGFLYPIDLHFSINFSADPPTVNPPDVKPHPGLERCIGLGKEEKERFINRNDSLKLTDYQRMLRKNNETSEQEVTKMQTKMYKS